MNIEKHYERLQESLEVIDECITKGVVERQMTIGFNVSAACCDMFEIYLHQNNLIDPGFIVKHEWFKSKHKTIEKFPFMFDEKETILNFIKIIEEKRDLLCYGVPKQFEEIINVLTNFNNLKEILKKKGVKIDK